MCNKVLSSIFLDSAHWSACEQCLATFDRLLQYIFVCAISDELLCVWYWQYACLICAQEASITIIAKFFLQGYVTYTSKNHYRFIQLCHFFVIRVIPVSWHVCIRHWGIYSQDRLLILFDSHLDCVVGVHVCGLCFLPWACCIRVSAKYELVLMSQFKK